MSSAKINLYYYYCSRSFPVESEFFFFFLPQADYNQWEMKKDTSTSGGFPCKI